MDDTGRTSKTFPSTKIIYKIKSNANQGLGFKKY